ncbi:MAG TPA: CsbD family protein [Streptosporangiaceae bacterium]|jgi:uncharacterized protein YjbJ (UPF0337 family)
MTITEKIAHTFEMLKGSLKKRTGRVTGGRRPRAKGRTDQAMGNVKQAGAKLRDALRH